MPRADSQTLDFIKAHSQPEGECILWTLAVDGHGMPVTRGREGRRADVRGLLYDDPEPRSGRFPIWKADCKNGSRCLAQQHLYLWGRLVRQPDGRWRAMPYAED